jgi:hypothetical protein
MRILATVSLLTLGALPLLPFRTVRQVEPNPHALRRPIDLGPVHGFVANLGQWSADVRFAATRSGTWLYVVADGSGRGLRTGRGAADVTMRAARSDHDQPAPTGAHPTGAVCHFLFGNDPAHHIRHVPVHAAVRLPTIAPGIDLLVRADAAQSGFAYDLEVAKGADVADAEFVVDGIEHLTIDATTGELVLVLHDGEPRAELRHSAPLAWIDDAGERRPVRCTFDLRGRRRFGFAAPDFARGEALCIDPDLRWSTTFGGSGYDTPYGVATAANGDSFVAGSTLSTTLPGTAGRFQPTFAGTNPVPFSVGDAFVARLAAANGALLWCTFLGGAENDRMMAAAGIGNDVVVTGWTSSTDYPTTPGAFDTTHNGTGDGYQYGGGDVFVTRVASDGASLVWSSFLGGSMLEYPSSIAVAPNGEVAVSGHVHSQNFPVTPGAHRSARLGFSDYFVTRFSADGSSLVGSTYAGGSDKEEYCHAMVILPDGDMVVAGPTDSAVGLATPGAYDTTYNGGTEHFADGFAARFDRTCTTLRWCTYIGTPNNEYVRGMTAHADGTLTFTGQIDGPGLPTTPGVAGPAHVGGLDGFVWRLTGDGTTSLWASYVGGSGTDRLTNCVDLGGGRVAVVGSTQSADAPRTRGALLSTPAGGEDGWLVVLSGDGTSIDYATGIGASSGEWAVDVERHADDDLVVTGGTWSGSFPITPGGATYSGGGDAFCIRLAALPVGTARHGAPSGGCQRLARVRARSGPFVGEGTFAVSCGDVPAGSPGLAAVASATLSSPLPVLGIDVWIDPNALLVTPGLTADAFGSMVLPIPVPPSAGLVGTSLAVQFVWLDACPGLAWGASDALVFVVQP